jgi:hypothetical protein
MAGRTVSGACDQGGACTVYGRLAALDAHGKNVNPGEGNCLLQGDVASLSWTISNTTDIPKTIEATGTLNPTTVIFNTLQTSANDPGYKGDLKGFNFKFTLPTGVLIKGARTYLFQLKIVTMGNSTGYARWMITTIPSTVP